MLHFSNILLFITTLRSSDRSCSLKKGILQNFGQASAFNFIKKEILTILWSLISCQFCEIFENTFFTEHLWAPASATSINSFSYYNISIKEVQNKNILFYKQVQTFSIIYFRKYSNIHYEINICHATEIKINFFSKYKNRKKIQKITKLSTVLLL